jgi:hypothetical protein
MHCIVTRRHVIRVESLIESVTDWLFEIGWATRLIFPWVTQSANLIVDLDYAVYFSSYSCPTVHICVVWMQSESNRSSRQPSRVPAITCQRLPWTSSPRRKHWRSSQHPPEFLGRIHTSDWRCHCWPHRLQGINKPDLCAFNKLYIAKCFHRV